MAMTLKQMKAFDAKINKVYLAIWKPNDTTIGGSIFIIAKSLNKARKKIDAYMKACSIVAELEVLKEYVPF